MASIRSSSDRGRAGPPRFAVPAWGSALLLLGTLVLLSIGVLRAFELAESIEVPRTAIGETRWFAFATRPDLQPALERWLVAVGRSSWTGPDEVQVGGVIDLGRVATTDRSWLLTMLRYACPGSTVELDGSSLRLEPACLPDLPEFLIDGRGPARWAWALTMGASLLLGLALTGGPRTRTAGDQTHPSTWMDSIGTLTVAWLVGWAILAGAVGLTWAVGRYGSEGAWTAAGAIVGLVLLGRRSRAAVANRCTGVNRFTGATSKETPARWSTWEWMLACVGSLLCFVGVGKILGSELWSWDHVAAWGFRARKIAVGSHDFLERPGFDGSNPDYPLGLAFSWLVGTGGAPPSGGDVRVATVLMILALGSLLFVMLEGLRGPLRLLIVGAMLAGPLVWDTEGLGLAELPFVVWLTAAVALWTPLGTRVRRAGWWSLMFLAMLAWTKQEGIVVAALLGAPGALWMYRRSGVRSAAIWCAGLTGSLAAIRWLTAAQTEHGTSFLEGGAGDRIMERLREPLEVLSLLPDTLAHPQWLPWYVALGLLVAEFARARPFFRGPGIGIGVMAASAGVAAAYVLVYFGTYLEPADHVATSWHRILGPVLWTLALGLTLAVGEARRASTGPTVRGARRPF